MCLLVCRRDASGETIRLWAAHCLFHLDDVCTSEGSHSRPEAVVAYRPAHRSGFEAAAVCAMASASMPIGVVNCRSLITESSRASFRASLNVSLVQEAGKLLVHLSHVREHKVK